MSRRLRFCAQLAAMAFIGLHSASAGAAEWHTNTAAFSSTDAGAVRLVIHSSSGPRLVQCQTSSISGTVNGPTSTALPWTNAATVTPALAGLCTVSGTGGYAMLCSSAEMRAIAYGGGTTFATAGGGVTTGSITGFDCRLTTGSTTCSTITGSTTTHYRNPNPIATGTGSLTVTGLGQTLTATKIGSGCAAVPNGAVTFGAPDMASGVLDFAFSIDGPNAPYIYRTP